MLYRFIFNCLVEYLQTLDLYANIKWEPNISLQSTIYMFKSSSKYKPRKNN